MVPRDEIAEADPGSTLPISPPAGAKPGLEMAGVPAPETVAGRRAWTGWDCALSTIILAGLASILLGLLTRQKVTA